MNYVQRLIAPLFRREAQKHLLTGNRKKALALFQMLYNWSPSAENQFNLALCLLNLRHYDEACVLLQSIHDRLPDQLFAGITYAQCLLLAKRFEDANQIYHKLLEANSSNHTLPLLITLCNDTVGRDKYVTSLDLQFQASLLQDDKQYQTALDMLQTAAGLTPDDAALHNNLGALKLKLKYPPEAVMADFAKAMELNPGNDCYRRNYRRVWQRIKK
jgi:tetratricopeptide (TPR) repeat protein